ncbi:MAG: N-acetylglucosamine kinase [Pyrinomonadaceae bacterium]
MTQNDLVLGLDGGGTSTVCLLADTQGRVLARVEAPASNHRKAGLSEARASLLSGVKAIARAAGIVDCSSLKLAAVCAGLAGVDTPDDALTMSGILREIISTDHLQVVNDGEIALVGALEDEPGVLVISGTGSIAWAASVNQQKFRVGGWDYILADEGSGYNIGSRVLRAVAAAHDKRIIPTCLTGGVFEAFKVPDFNKLLGVIYHEEMTPQRIASLAPLADEAAAGGDQAAINILHEASVELAALVISAARLAGLEQQAFPIVAMGGVLLAGGFFADSFREVMAAAAPAARFLAPRHTSAEGAVLLALRSLDAEHGAYVQS